ncbi:MAG TPA: hypothetical protein VIQ25_05530 [Gemmatimonadales bacterium]|jgi:hypothetical protein
MRLFRRAAALSAVSAAVLAAACGEDTPTDPTPVPPLSADVSLSLVPLDVYGLGAAANGCDAAPYRQFDFWVGRWDVFSGATLAGTNEVKSRVDGCVVEENWTSAGAGRGRSLNAYDAATGTWSQFWVGSGGCQFSVILMEGGFANGSMTMQGSRTQPEGFLIAPPCGPPPGTVVTTHTDLFRWTLLQSGDVLQQIAAANDAPVVPPPDPSAGIGLRYEAVDQVTPLSPPEPSFCPFRAAARQFDYMLGTWQVHQGSGEGAQGTASFSTDLATCLVEENFSGPGGYEGLSYNTFDLFTLQWIRTWVDSQGRRIVMRGGPDESGAMVLQGSRPAPGGRSVEVRITWRPENANEVVQVWEYSTDGGTSWKGEKEIRYTR